MTERLDGEALWRAWRRIIKTMTVPGLVFEMFFSRAAWSQWGADYVSGLRRNASSRKVFAELAALTPADARRLLAIAAINHRRLEAVSRWVAIALVTVPASLALTIAQLRPEWLKGLSLEPRQWIFVGSTALVVLYYLLAAWRARQIVTVIELGFVDRGIPLNGGEIGDDGEPLTPPIGA
ncbi:hypothetical protein [Phenylobacterium sp. J367]|uniref:hypothetical protein n=1 Tax=Phenylobacterium sp. J367 TaxID=2898435 RepID=UPI0021510966|nr:hypothetical protein [Phenylobacterium sp. J367]MCR5878344.1 hypothetical protein [Phenylobacterium sp. J367]